MKFVCVFLAFVAIATASSSVNERPAFKLDSPKLRSRFLGSAVNLFGGRKPVENVNDFVDFVITEVSSFIVKYGFDPMELPAFDETVDVAGNDVEIHLSGGKVMNASIMYRNGDVKVTYKRRILNIEIPVFFKLFKLNYDYKLLVGEEKKPYEGTLLGEVYVVDVLTVVEVDFKELSIKLKSFNIPTMGAINLDFDGEMMPELKEALKELVSGKFKKLIVGIVEQVCNFVLKSIFDVVNDILGSIKP